MKATSIGTVLAVRLRHEPGMLARLAAAIAEHHGLLCEIVTVRVGDEHTQREITVETDNQDQVARIIVRAAVETRARTITSEMMIEAARAIAGCAEPGELVPSPLDRSLHDAITAAVSRCIHDTGIANTASP